MRNQRQAAVIRPVEDASLWETFNGAEVKMFAAAQTKKTATSYGLSNR